MPESRQALLFDRARSTHLLVEVGQPVDGYRVDTIEDDEVTLSREGTQVVLAAPLHGARNRARAANDGRATPDLVAVPPRMSDAPSFAPLDPYGEPVRSASAGDPAGEGVRVASAAGVDGTTSDAGPLPADPNVRTVRAPDNTRAASDGGLAAAAAALGLAPEPSAPVASAPAATALTAPAASAPPASAPPLDPVGAAPDPVGAAPDPVGAAPDPVGAAPDPAAAPAPEPPAAPAKPSRKRATTRTPAKPAHASQSDDAQALADILSADKPGRRAPALSGSEPAATPSPVAPAPALAPAPASSAPAPATDAHTGPVAALSTSLTRAEIDASLADFATLSSALSASFSPTGVVLDRVDNPSIFQRAGLRSGDTITAIDGVRLRSIDDAASLYARVTTASAITVQLQRGGKPIHLRVLIQ